MRESFPTPPAALKLDIPFDLPLGPVGMAPPLRPAPTPTCAGLTPGYEFLVVEARRKKRMRLRAALRAERRVRKGQFAHLVNENQTLREAVERLDAEVARLRDDQGGA
jgi:hypothetical protein